MAPDEVPGRRRSNATHRRLALAVAVIAVLVVAASVVATVEVAGQVSGDPKRTVRFSAADLSTADPSFRLGPDQVPSIAGLDAEQATALLTSAGYDVRVATREGCASAGDELTLEPQTGTILEPGATVTLHEVVPSPGADCAQADHPDFRVLTFLAWARGLGPAPDFADKVRVEFAAQYASGGSTRVLQHAEIADRQAWPGLTALADALAAPTRRGDTLVPLVISRLDATCAPPPGGTCPVWPGAAISGSWIYARGKADTDPLFNVALLIGAHHRITAVTLFDRRHEHPNVDPDVVGDSEAYAAARLKAYGFKVTAAYADFSCAQRDQVIATAPSGINTVSLEVSRPEATCAA